MREHANSKFPDFRLRNQKIFRCTLMRMNSRGAFIIACRCCWAVTITTPGKPERGGVELLRPTPNTFMADFETGMCRAEEMMTRARLRDINLNPDSSHANAA